MLMDVAPLSLGIELYDGTMSIVIPRNQSIPTKVVHFYVNACDFQTSCSCKAHEDERPIAKDNNFLGRFLLSWLTPMPRHSIWFNVCSNSDADGILTVSAEDTGNTCKNQITITNHKGRLSKEEIDRMVEEAVKYSTEDEEHKKAYEAKNALESYVGSITRALTGCGKKINIKDKRKLGDAIAKTTQWMEWNYLLDNATKFENKLKELESICEPILAKLHQHPQDADTIDITHEIIELD